MLDPKEAYKKILEEHLHDLILKPMNVYSLAWLDSRYHILELLGFKKIEMDTIEKVEKIMEKYNKEIERWKQK